MADRSTFPAHPPRWGDAAAGAALATLERPSLWPIGLVGFLVRGGLLAFVLPILALPTPAGLQARLSPLLVPLVFGQVSPALATLLAVSIALSVGLILVGLIVGGWADGHLIRAIAHAEVEPGRRRDRLGQVAALAVARAVAHLPLAAALGWGSGRIVAAAYAELITPLEIVTPVTIRVLAAVPDAVAVVVVAWLLGEAAGGLAAREVVLGGRGAVAAAVRGWLGLVGRPGASAATLLLGSVVVLVAAGPALVAASTAWAAVRYSLLVQADPVAAVVTVIGFVALWLGGLLLAAATVTLRANLWTGEWLRRRAVAGHRRRFAPRSGAAGRGTIGGAPHARPGESPRPGASGTL